MITTSNVVATAASTTIVITIAFATANTTYYQHFLAASE